MKCIQLLRLRGYKLVLVAETFCNKYIGVLHACRLGFVGVSYKRNCKILTRFAVMCTAPFFFLSGIRGTYQGLTPTILKQGTNQMIRFFVYGNLKEWFQGGDPSKKVGMLTTAFCGATAGAASVFGNTPIDVVKTRLQVSYGRSGVMLQVHFLCASFLFLYSMVGGCGLWVWLVFTVGVVYSIAGLEDRL